MYSMSEDLESEKRKYLRKAKQLLEKPEKPVSRKLQASVEPFSHQAVHRKTGCDGILERNNSDPTCGTAVTSVGPLVQRVAPTVRASPTEMPSSPTLRSHLEPHTPCGDVCGEKLAVQIIQGASDGGDDGMVNSGSDGELDNSTPSPRHISTSLRLPSLADDRNHMLVSSTPLLPRTKDHADHRHPFTSDAEHTTLNARCSELKAKLRLQTDTNKELKRLLVASMGSDLQHCLNHIAEEKATISQDLDASLQRLAENHEEIDRVSIECDIWRSKFLASRLMIDELAGWKAEETRQLKESQRALQCMLRERAELSNSLLQCNHHLGELTACFKPRNEMQNKFGDCTVLEMAKEVSSKARHLLSTFEGSRVTPRVNSTAHARGVGKPTTGEKLAKQVLRSGSGERSLPTPSRLSDKPLRPLGGYQSPPSPHPTLHHHRHLLASESAKDILFHCNKCKGNIYHV